MIQYANDRAAGIAKLRAWASGRIAAGESVASVHAGLHSALDALLQEFRIEHDTPGTRYWHVPETGAYYSTMAGESLSPSNLTQSPIELKRYEFIARLGLWNGTGDRL